MRNKPTKQDEINVNGNVDSSTIIVGSQNQVNISNNLVADKLASELAIRRLRQDIDELVSKRENIKNAGCLSAIFSNNCGGLAVIAFVSIILAMVIVTNSQRMGMDIAFWITIVFIFTIIIIAKIIDSLSEKEVAQKRDFLDKKIDEKYVELERHEKVVNSK